MEDIICTIPVDTGDGWTKAHYWSYDDGTFSVCDPDGNHDDIDEQDLPTAEEERQAWIDYSRDVAGTGKDPLGEFMVPRAVATVEAWRFRFSDSIVGPVLLQAKRRAKAYQWHELPQHIAEYLGLQGSARLSVLDSWSELVDAQPMVKPGQWLRVRIEHSAPRDEAAVSRDLVRAARKHLRQEGCK